MTEPTFWNYTLVWPIVNILALFYKGFLFLGVPGAFGFAILGLTIMVRLVLWPMTSAQLKSAKKMADLKPHLDKIKQLHGHDKTRHLEEQQKLYKQHGVNPAAGCLPFLVQIPIIYALLGVFNAVFYNSKDLVTLTGEFNKILYFPFLHLDQPIDVSFFGSNLTAKPADWQQLGWWLLAIPVATALLQLVQSLMMMPPQVAVRPNDTKVEKKEKESMEDTMAQVQGQMLFMMPLMFGVFAYQFPIGLALYWNTFTAFGILQQYRVSGWGGLIVWIKKLSTLLKK